jgi:hypothetical protein
MRLTLSELPRKWEPIKTPFLSLTTGIDLGRRELASHELDMNRSPWDDDIEEELPMTFDRRRRLEPPIYIRPGLFIGSVASERHLQGLKDAGITHVLQVCTLWRTLHAPFLCP